MNDELGEADEIRTSRATVRVPWEKRSELMERLEKADMKEAAEDLRNRGGFAEARKPGVLGVLDAWLVQVEHEAFGPELLDLRDELRRDVENTQTH